MKGKLIVIVGPVGVGKSTVINALSKVLSYENVSVMKTFLKAFHGPCFVIWLLATKLINNKRKTIKLRKYAPWYILTKFNEVLARRIALLTSLLDVTFTIPSKLLWINLLKRVGYVVLCEEYLYGTLIDYIYSLISIGNHKGKRLLRFTIAILAAMLRKYKPSIVIALDADITEIIKRWEKRGYGDPQLKYVKFQRIFLKKLSYSETIFIDTNNRSISEIVKLILKTLKKKDYLEALGERS